MTLTAPRTPTYSLPPMRPGLRAIVGPMIGPRPDLENARPLSHFPCYPVAGQRQEAYVLRGGGFALCAANEAGTTWRFWPNVTAYEDYVGSLVSRDSEGRMGDFRLSDCERLKVRLDDGVSVVDCSGCRIPLPFVEAAYRVRGLEQRDYLPFCPDCAP